MKNLAIFMPLSREWRIEDMASQICRLQVPSYIGRFDVVIIVDNNQIETWAIHRAFEKYGWNTTHSGKIIVRNTDNPPMNEVNVGQRRDRITKVWEMAKRVLPDYIDLVFGIEDDTDIEPHYLMELYNDYQNLLNMGTKVGIVSGVQAGRWGFKMIGAWKADNPKDPKILFTIPFNELPIIQDIDAAGFYCFITRRELIMKSQFKFNNFGPDVNFGLDLRAQGYQNFVDWSIKAAHRTPTACILPDEECITVKYELKDNAWRRTEPGPHSTL